MSENTYEKLRTDIQALLSKTCIKEAEDKSRVAYSWNIGKVFSEMEKNFPNILLNGKLPEGFKSIVRFEFNKLKDSVMTSEHWEARRSTISYALTSDGVEKRRQDLFGMKVITLEDQLNGARILLDKVGKSLAKSKSQEDTQRINKRKNRILKEIMFLTDAINMRNSVANTAVPVQSKTTVKDAELTPAALADKGGFFAAVSK